MLLNSALTKGNVVKIKKKIMIIIGIAVLSAFAGGLCTSVMAEENQGTWHKVGKDVKETVKDVGVATKQTYEKTKQKSVEAWQKTKEGSKEAYDKSKKAYDSSKKESKGFWASVEETVVGWYESAKAAIHSATAPAKEKKEPEKSSGASQ
jgi:hypothetical protein